MALVGELSWLECHPVAKGLPVQFLVWEHAWVAGSMLSLGMGPCQGMCWGWPMDASLSHGFFSLSPLFFL